MRFFNIILAIIVSLIFVSCSTNSNFTKTSKETYPAVTNYSDVKVILENKDVPVYDEIGTCEISQKSNHYLDFGGAIEQARKIAMKNGGNLVLLKEKRNGSDSFGERYTFIVGRLKTETVTGK